MAIEKRDPESKAKLFVPTNSEKTARSQRVKLDKTLIEVEALKVEMQEALNAMKKNR